MTRVVERPGDDVLVHAPGSADTHRVLKQLEELLDAYGLSSDLEESGSSNIFVGDLGRRAPVVLQRLGLEWIWRASREPARIVRRYLTIGRSRRRPGVGTVIYLDDGTWRVAPLPAVDDELRSRR